MKRKQRTEILIDGAPDIAAALAQEIEGRYEVTTLETPNHGLVMVKVRETAQNSLFYLGETLVTECKVRIAGHTGVGLLSGDRPEMAYRLAVIDAAYEAQLEETAAWTAVLQAESERLQAERHVLEEPIRKTKVQFETMDTE
ncbi:phosphonate C-P lyase system protein PhnG [Paenibacillus koleovorans]|uniref:phosphonate C-P lyase system protein PhnG n=1 Tax=Paenibacillus koleovorans TaxID=121608 RepID=UPI000FD8806C|nr:phosphonate C-P lyase system protein PhnG [Paenibacillus koleovorans]